MPDHESNGMQIPEPLDWNKRAKSVPRFLRPSGLRAVAAYVDEHKPSRADLVEAILSIYGGSRTVQMDFLFLRRAGLFVGDNDAVKLSGQMRDWLASGGENASMLIAVMHSRIRLIGELLAEVEARPQTIEQLRALATSKYGLVWQATTQVSRRMQWLEFAGLVAKNNRLRAITQAGRDFLSRLTIYVPDAQNGEPRYWLMSLGEGARFWDECYLGGFACLGWDHLGDLSQYRSIAEIRAQGLENPSALACWDFYQKMQPGDIIFSKRTRRGPGQAIGHGIVPRGSQYEFDESRNEYNHVRDVEWRSNFPEGLVVRDEDLPVKTLTDITDYPDLVEQFKDALGIDGDLPENPMYSIETILAEGSFLEQAELERLELRLKDKKNVILQGPPGTGKTWLAKRLAYALIGQRDPSRVRAVQFHPTLSYEDFVYGWRPADDGLELVDGTFLRAIKAAMADPLVPYVVVIEEINRGNPAQIFGELITLLESDKRTEEAAIELAYAQRGEARAVYVPENLYVLGTMNIADRSLALVDLALRRRFAFETLKPRLNARWRSWVVNEMGVEENLVDDIQRRMSRLNDSITGAHGLGKQFRVGHSYVTPTHRLASGDTRPWFKVVVETEIVPLLEEYWFDDAERVDQERDALLANW